MLLERREISVNIRVDTEIDDLEAGRVGADVE